MKVVIVGGGPAGLFAAYKLGNKYDVALIDKGKPITHRKCPKQDKGTCVNCKICDVAHGIGGAGLFSDGKLIYSTKTGNNLPGIIGEQKTQLLLDKVEEIFNIYGIKTEQGDIEKQNEMVTRAAQLGIEYVPSKQAHVGSDKLPLTLDELVKDIGKNVNIIEEETAVDIDIENKKLECKNKTYNYDHLILAIGRAGNRWLQEMVDKHEIKYECNPLDIGVRVEVPSSIMQKACETNWDFKARMRTPTYQDMIRTFCVCPYGFVTRLNFDDYCLVNGHSEKERKSQNTNFAFLINYKLTEPIRNGNLYGETIAKKATFIGGGKPILQRLGDLKKGHRSTWDRLNQNLMLKPTLKDVTPGDIGSALEYRFVLDIIEGLDNLDKLVKGVANDSTLLYLPEIKFLGIKVLTNEYLQTNVDGIIVAGDGAGLSRGIVGAAASGILAADGILGFK